MALFGKLFEKKVCDFCGGEIGLLGNRKLEDGNMCKECAAKLSPWFDDRRNSTVEQIQQQLNYREANKAKVEAFRSTLTFGESKKIHIDEYAGNFLVSSRSGVTEWRGENPDVLALSDISACELDVTDSRTEVKRKDKDGNMVSFVPPRYEYRFDFYIELTVRNPYFDKIRFRLNANTVEIEGQAAIGRTFNAERNAKYIYYADLAQDIKNALMQSRSRAAQPQQGYQQPGYQQQGYQQNGYQQQGVGNVVAGGAVGTAAAAQGFNQMNQAPQQAAGWTCPSCGTSNTGRFCQGCGQPQPAAQPVQNASWFCQNCGTKNTGKFCQGCGQPQQQMAQQPQYQQNQYQQPQYAAAPQAAPAQGPVTCPYCGGSTTPDANGNCEWCGGKVR